MRSEVLKKFIFSDNEEQIGWNLSRASFEGKEHCVNEDISSQGLFFKSDGTKMYVVGSGFDRVNQYTLSSAWDVTTAKFDNVIFDTGEGALNDIFFKPDGTKFYTIGSVSDTVQQYSLGTAWDISSASYDSVSFSVNSQESIPTGLFFMPDGSTFYIVGSSTDRAREYSLSTPWDISTATYVTTTTVLNDSSPQAIFFKPNGTKFYVVGTNTDSVQQYSTLFSWSVSGASYDSVSSSVGSTTPNGLFFKPDGTRLYTVDSSSNLVYQYDLGTAWVVSSLTETGTFSISEESSPAAIFFKPDGTKMYIGGEQTDNIHQYSLSVPWDISTASYDSVFLSADGRDSAFTGMYFKSDGTMVFTTGSGFDRVYPFSLSTPWDFTSASNDTSYSVSQTSSLEDVSFSTDGTKMFCLGDNTIYQYTLSTPWTVTSASYDSVSLSVSGQETAASGFFFREDGLALFVVGTASDTVYRYNLSNAWDVSSSSYSGQSLVVSSTVNNPVDIFLKPDGLQLYVLGSSTDTAYQYIFV